MRRAGGLLPLALLVACGCSRDDRADEDRRLNAAAEAIDADAAPTEAISNESNP